MAGQLDLKGCQVGVILEDMKLLQELILAFCRQATCCGHEYDLG